MELQKVSLRILTDVPAALSLDPFLAIFGRWRADASHPAQWVDLADYAHMARGPGVVLVGHRSNFSFDLGVVYLSKKGLAGSPEDRLFTVFRDAFTLTRALLAEPEFPPYVHVRTGALELVFNDRLETPHTAATDEALRPAVTTVLDRLFGPAGYCLTLEPDPGRRYGFTISADPAPTPEVLAGRIPG